LAAARAGKQKGSAIDASEDIEQAPLVEKILGASNGPSNRARHEIWQPVKPSLIRPGERTWRGVLVEDSDFAPGDIPRNQW
jgi:hypothetical protein